MSFVTRIDLARADQRERLTVALGLTMAPLIVLAALEQQLTGLAALTATLAAAVAAGLAWQAWRRQQGAKTLMLLVADEGAAISGEVGDRSAGPVPVRVQAAWRLGGICWLELEMIEPALPARQNGPLAPARRKVARGSAWPVGAESQGAPGRLAPRGQGNVRPMRMTVLLSRRSLFRQWPALLRWLVREQRLGR